MNNNPRVHWQAGGILLGLFAACIIFWTFFHESPHASTATTSPSAATSPAHDVSSAAQKNMQDAEAKRLKQLNVLTFPKAFIVYARIVDQSGRPVRNAKVDVQSGISVTSQVESLEETSDSDGAVSFAKKWPVLSITVTKPGYQRLLASSATFEYAKSMFTPPAKAGPENPVVFVMLRN